MKWIFRVYIVVMMLALAVLIAEFRAGGLVQQLAFGMKPPYHWIIDPDPTSNWGDASKDTYWFRTWDYKGANGKDCAVLWGDREGWTVYGYGFNEKSQDVEALANIAYKHCY